MTTGISYDPRFLDHDTGPRHPENSKRLVVTLEHLNAQPWYGDLAQVVSTPADPARVETVHKRGYLDRVQKTCRAGAPIVDSMDVNVCPASFDIALLAAGAPLSLADEIFQGRIDNGLALVRPPGHHAENDMALGFCLFNNVAVLARYVQREYGIDKVLILDWDVHHGNGTQHMFEEDPSVFYISTHQYPYYPGSGAYSETGLGHGHGATLNCPLPAGSGDRDYETAFREKILPAAERFKPEFIIISAGFDAHARDPLAHMELTTAFYAWMTERMMELAEKHAGGRIVSVLEGGYDPEALSQCVAIHLHTLLGHKAP
jgi:acetoin utilization deacetylase AcuC-like enzyme